MSYELIRSTDTHLPQGNYIYTIYKDGKFLTLRIFNRDEQAIGWYKVVKDNFFATEETLIAERLENGEKLKVVHKKVFDTDDDLSFRDKYIIDVYHGYRIIKTWVSFVPFVDYTDALKFYESYTIKEVFERMVIAQD